MSNEEQARISSIFNGSNGTETQKLERIYARLQSLRSSREDVSRAIDSETGGNADFRKLLESTANLNRVGSRIEGTSVTSPLNETLQKIRQLGTITPSQRNEIIQHLTNMGKAPSADTLDTLTDKGILQLARKINRAEYKN